MREFPGDLFQAVVDLRRLNRVVPGTVLDHTRLDRQKKVGLADDRNGSRKQRTRARTVAC
jgi:hypothetical protein